MPLYAKSPLLQLLLAKIATNPLWHFFVNDSTDSCFVLMELFHRLNVHTDSESSWLSCKHANM